VVLPDSTSVYFDIYQLTGCNLTQDAILHRLKTADSTSPALIPAVFDLVSGLAARS